MKRLLLVFSISFLGIGCNDQSTTETTVNNDSSAAGKADTSKIEYAYTVDHPADNWDRGDMWNAAMVLQALKAYETGNIEECVKNFADSVRLAFDYYQDTVSKDSLRAIFTRDRNELKSLIIDMDDFESVISKDKKNEYVSLWYKQIWTDKKGKTDSISVMDDVKIVNGKIASIDQKIQHYQVKKK